MVNEPFPLHAPARALAVIAIGKEVEIPHIIVVSMVIDKPVRMVGFRPK